jgi:hypothetical protein
MSRDVGWTGKTSRWMAFSLTPGSITDRSALSLPKRAGGFSLPPTSGFFYVQRSALIPRRRFLSLLSSSAALLLLTGHTPYRQWKVYRQTHLLVFTSRDDPRSDELGERIAARLRELLPESKAQVARAPHAARIASLITTNQADVAVLSRANAAALFARQAPFGDYLPVELRVLVENEEYQLVCREDFKPEHAYLVAEALAGESGEAGLAVPLHEGGDAGIVPTHPGALAFARGERFESL